MASHINSSKHACVYKYEWVIDFVPSGFINEVDPMTATAGLFYGPYKLPTLYIDIPDEILSVRPTHVRVKLFGATSAGLISLISTNATRGSAWEIMTSLPIRAHTITDVSEKALLINNNVPITRWYQFLLIQALSSGTTPVGQTLNNVYTAHDMYPTEWIKLDSNLPKQLSLDLCVPTGWVYDSRGGQWFVNNKLIFEFMKME